MGLFQDSLKKWFYTNNSSAASSDARVPLLNANGTPKGSDTMANLASVLSENGYQNGLLKVISHTDYQSLDDIPGGTIMSLGGGSGKTNLPTAERCTIITAGWQDNRRHQMCFDFVNGYVYIRALTNSNWSSWVTPDVDELNGKCIHIGAGASSFTINKGSQQCILAICINGPSEAPSVFSCTRTSAQTLFQGSVPANALAFDESGNITVTKYSAHMYYRIWGMEM